MRQFGSSCVTRRAALSSRGHNAVNRRARGRRDGWTYAPRRPQDAERAIAGARRRQLCASRLSCVPKTIRRADGKGAGAIVGFANTLIRFHDTEQPRAVIVGWDSLEAPNWRRELFPPYQSGRQFDDELIEQLNLLPEFVTACGFRKAKASGFEADDFLAAAVAAEEQTAGTVLVASGDRDAFQLASERTTILYPVRAGEIARIDPEEVRARTASTRSRFPTSLRFAATLPTRFPAPSGWAAAGGSALATIRDPGRRPRGWPLPHAGGIAPPLSEDCQDGHIRAAALARQPKTDVGRRVRPRAPMGPQSTGRPPGGEVAKPLIFKSAAPTRIAALWRVGRERERVRGDVWRAAIGESN